RMLKGLTGHEHVNAVRLQFAPVVGLAQDQVDTLAWGKVDAEIMPRFSRENGAIRAGVIATAHVDNRERLVLARRELVAAKLRHSIIGTRVHRFASMFVKLYSGSGLCRR